MKKRLIASAAICTAVVSSLSGAAAFQSTVYLDQREAIGLSGARPSAEQQAQLRQMEIDVQKAYADVQTASTNIQRNTNTMTAQDLRRKKEDLKLLESRRNSLEESYKHRREVIMLKVEAAGLKKMEAYVDGFMDATSVDVLKVHGSGLLEDNVIIINEAFEVSDVIGEMMKSDSLKPKTFAPLEAPTIKYISYEAFLAGAGLSVQYRAEMNKLHETFNRERQVIYDKRDDLQGKMQIGAASGADLDAIGQELLDLEKTSNYLLEAYETRRRKRAEELAVQVKSTLAAFLKARPAAAEGADIIRVYETGESIVPVIYLRDESADITEAVASAYKKAVGTQD